MFSNFFHGQMLFHAKALEFYTSAFQSLLSMDEEQDIEVLFIPSCECKRHIFIFSGLKKHLSVSFLTDNTNCLLVAFLKLSQIQSKLAFWLLQFFRRPRHAVSLNQKLINLSASVTRLSMAMALNSTSSLTVQ